MLTCRFIGLRLATFYMAIIPSIGISVLYLYLYQTLVTEYLKTASYFMIIIVMIIACPIYAVTMLALLLNKTERLILKKALIN